jgi:DUF1016 N-terminal domain
VTDANDEMGASPASTTSAVNSAATEGGTPMTKPTAVSGNAKIVRTGIEEMLKAARCAVTRNVNWHLRTTYREIGRQIAKSEELVEQPAVDRTRQSGRGFARRNLFQVRAFDSGRPEQQIRQTLSEKYLIGIVSNNIESNPSSVLRAAARSDLPCFPILRLLSKRNREARSFYETEGLDSG